MSLKSSGGSKKEEGHQAPVIQYFHGGRDPLGRTHDEMVSYSLERMEECHDYVQWMWPLHEPSAFAEVYPVLTEEQVSILRASEEARARMLASLRRFRLFYGLPPLPDTPSPAPHPQQQQEQGQCASESGSGSGSGSGGAATEGGAACAQTVGTLSPTVEKEGGSAGGVAEEGGSATTSGMPTVPANDATAAATTTAVAADAAPPADLPPTSSSSHPSSTLPPGFSEERASMWCHNGDHNNLRVTRIIRSLRFFGLERESREFYEDVLTVAKWSKLGSRTLGFWKKSSEGGLWDSLRG